MLCFCHKCIHTWTCTCVCVYFACTYLTTILASERYWMLCCASSYDLIIMLERSTFKSSSLHVTSTSSKFVRLKIKNIVARIENNICTLRQVQRSSVLPSVSHFRDAHACCYLFLILHACTEIRQTHTNARLCAPVS